MSSWVDLDDEICELATTIAEHLGSSRGRVMKMALMLLAIDLGLRVKIPRKEKEDAG